MNNKNDISCLFARKPLPLLCALIVGGLFATPLAQADALHDQASALFKPIPEQVTELRGESPPAAPVDCGCRR